MALFDSNAGTSEGKTSMFGGSFGGTSNEEGRDLVRGYGISHRNIFTFTNIKDFKNVCADRFEQTSYVAFYRVTQRELAQIDHYRDRHLRSTRVLYDEELNLLIVKFMPNKLHGSTASLLSHEILYKLSVFGKPLVPIGDGRIGNLGERFKEADGGFIPRTRPSESWPSFVFEVGVLQTLLELGNDAHHWLTRSGGLTHVVLLVKLDKARQSMVIEQWEDIPRLRPLRAVRAAVSPYNPGIVNRISLTRNGGCRGTPLDIAYAKIIDVLPVGMAPNGVLQFSAGDLCEFYASIRW